MSNTGDFWRGVFQAAIDWLYPPCCPLCGEPDSTLCRHCERALASGNRRAIPRHLVGLDGVWASGLHQEWLREGIRALKFGGVLNLVVPLGRRLGHVWNEVGGEIHAVLAVPLHEARRAERGFNQAELLAQTLAAQIARPLRSDCLRRQIDTRSQVGLSPQERSHNVSDAFLASSEITGMRLLLIDDVCTSGATLVACAQALRAAGAVAVYALTVSTTTWQSGGARQSGQRQTDRNSYNE